MEYMKYKIVSLILIVLPLAAAQKKLNQSLSLQESNLGPLALGIAQHKIIKTKEYQALLKEKKIPEQKAKALLAEYKKSKKWTVQATKNPYFFTTGQEPNDINPPPYGDYFCDITFFRECEKEAKKEFNEPEEDSEDEDDEEPCWLLESKGICSLNGLPTYKNNFANLVDLYLSDNHIKTIPNGIFCTLSSLKNIVLSNNKISHIEDNAFQGLQNLKRLDLARNCITHFTPKHASFLRNIEKLYLYKNAITEINPEIFLLEDVCADGTIEKILSKLENLWLNNNKLETFPLQECKTLPNLKDLRLTNNPLKDKQLAQCFKFK